MPTAGLSTATWVPGTAAHSWQAVAASGHPVGLKGAELAAQVMAQAALALFSDPATIRQARAEFDRRRGPHFHYRSLLDRPGPPLDYRNPAR